MKFTFNFILDKPPDAQYDGCQIEGGTHGPARGAGFNHGGVRPMFAESLTAPSLPGSTPSSSRATTLDARPTTSGGMIASERLTVTWKFTLLSGTGSS